MHSGRPTVRSRKPNNYNVQQRVGNGTECTGNSRFKNQVIYNQPTDWPTNQPNYQQPTKPSRPNLLFSNTLVFLSCFCPHCLSVAAASSSSSSSLGNRLPFETDDKNDNFTFRKCFFSGKKCANSLSLLTQHKHLWASGWERRMSPLPQSNSHWTELQFLPRHPSKAISIRQLEINLPEGQVCLCSLALLSTKLTLIIQRFVPLAIEKFLSCQVGPRPVPSTAPFLTWRHLTPGHQIRPSRSCSRSFGVTQGRPKPNRVFLHWGDHFYFFSKERVRLFANSQPREKSKPAFRFLARINWDSTFFVCRLWICCQNTSCQR